MDRFKLRLISKSKSKQTKQPIQNKNQVSNKKSKQIILLIGLYAEKDQRRLNEYLECIKINENNKHISNIVIFWEEPTPLEFNFNSPKINVVNIKRRITFNDLIGFANANYQGHIMIIANTDIYFDDTLQLLENYDLTSKLLCLTRWEDQLKHIGRADSQDSWIFLSPLKKFACNWYLGMNGCDNKLAYEAQQSGLQVINPSYSIKSHHKHHTGVRHYVNTPLQGPRLHLQSCYLNGDIFQFLSTLLSNNKQGMILELGAHHLEHTQRILDVFSKVSKYLAFEPDPRNINICWQHPLVRDQKVKFFPIAIGDKVGKVSFFQSSGDIWGCRDWDQSSSILEPTGHIQRYPTITFQNRLEVECTTLEQIFNSENLEVIDLIWMDVQGAEHLVFQGGINVLSRVHYIYTEYYDQPLYKDQLSLFKLLNILPSTFRVLEDYNENVLLENTAFGLGKHGFRTLPRSK